MPKENPHWEKKYAHSPDGFTPLEEMADPDALTPEEVLMLEEKLKDPALHQEQREEIIKVIARYKGELREAA